LLETLLGKTMDAAVALAEAFFRAVPSDKKKRLSEKEWTLSLARFHRDAKAIRLRYALGFIGRARAAYYFQQRLIAAGFQADVVRKVVFSLVLNSLSSSA
jgi:hypothetical protein